MPSAAALIVAAPLPAAVASPLTGSTDATSGRSPDQAKVTGRVTAFPFGSRASAVRAAVASSASSVTDPGVTSTAATACVTVSAASPDADSLVALMTAV